VYLLYENFQFLKSRKAILFHSKSQEGFTTLINGIIKCPSFHFIRLMVINSALTPPPGIIYACGTEYYVVFHNSHRDTLAMASIGKHF
jgi:hypothetical protein